MRRRWRLNYWQPLRPLVRQMEPVMSGGIGRPLSFIIFFDESFGSRVCERGLDAHSRQPLRVMQRNPGPALHRAVHGVAAAVVVRLEIRPVVYQ